MSDDAAILRPVLEQMNAKLDHIARLLEYMILLRLNQNTQEYSLLSPSGMQSVSETRRRLADNVEALKQQPT